MWHGLDGYGGFEWLSAYISIFLIIFLISGDPQLVYAALARCVIIGSTWACKK